ncbi:MAG: pyridoxal-phosphate dependent enzyme [Bacteroidales bacterium]
MQDQFPTSSDILDARTRIHSYIHKTQVITNSYINSLVENEVFFKCENFQKAGAFKSRGAVNSIMCLRPDQQTKGVATHSSGNHAQALARAAQLFELPAYIVMPKNAPLVKIAAVKDYGGIITFCEPTLEARESTLRKVIEKTGAVEIHPYNNYTIITGQATAAAELFEQTPKLDYLLCPVGGGGLLSGTALSTAYFSEGTRVIACEPAGADDAFRSFYSGEIVPSVLPLTIADGLLTSLGARNFPIILKYVDGVVTVSEASIVEAMRLLYERAKIVIEPSSAVPLAALIEGKVPVKGKKIGIILSGGNVDLATLPFCNKQ